MPGWLSWGGVSARWRPESGRRLCPQGAFSGAHGGAAAAAARARGRHRRGYAAGRGTLLDAASYGARWMRLSGLTVTPARHGGPDWICETKVET